MRVFGEARNRSGRLGVVCVLAAVALIVLGAAPAAFAAGEGTVNVVVMTEPPPTGSMLTDAMVTLEKKVGDTWQFVAQEVTGSDYVADFTVDEGVQYKVSSGGAAEVFTAVAGSQLIYLYLNQYFVLFKVTLPGDLAVQGATVTVSGVGSETTDSQGLCAFTLEAGTYSVSAQKDAMTGGTTVDVPPAVQPVVIQLSGGGGGTPIVVSPF